MRTQSREVGGAAGPQVDRTVGGAAMGMRSGSSSPAKVQGLSSDITLSERVALGQVSVVGERGSRAPRRGVQNDPRGGDERWRCHRELVIHATQMQMR